MLQSCIEFDCMMISGGLLEAPLYPLKPGVSRGPPGLSGGPCPLGSPRNSTTGWNDRKSLQNDVGLTGGGSLCHGVKITYYTGAENFNSASDNTGSLGTQILRKWVVTLNCTASVDHQCHCVHAVSLQAANPENSIKFPADEVTQHDEFYNCLLYTSDAADE